MLPGSAARPAAVCLGMGVALLASVSISRTSPQLWRAIQRMRYSTGMSTTVLRGKPSVFGDASVAAEYLQCVHELEHVHKSRLSKYKITVVQVGLAIVARRGRDATLDAL